jgi:hypothetical protein
MPSYRERVVERIDRIVWLFVGAKTRVVLLRVWG